MLSPVLENVSTMLGPNVKINFKALLKLELKADKLENRLLIFTQYRLYIFNTKGSTKLETSYNYVDINSIESLQTDKLTISFRQCDSRHYNLYSCDPNQEEINLIICYLVKSLKTLFPHVPLETFIKRLEVEPRSRLESVYNYVHLIDEKIRLHILDFPCGGFSNQYACFCDYYGLTFRDEVSWDIDTIYAAHNNTELSLLDFEHLDLKDLLPIIAALTHNGYFTKFRVSNIKLVNSSQSGSEQLCELIINLVRRSNTLEEIYLDNTGIRADFVNKLFQAMLLNNQTSIQIIDLSNNSIEDKGLKNMTSFVAKSFHMANTIANASSEDLNSSLSLSYNNSTSQINHNLNKNTVTSSAKLMYKGLVNLNLSHCGITSKGISELSESLYLNKSMFSTLTHLNLSDNYFKDDISKLYNFLAQPNNLSNLDLSGTDCNLDTVFGALLHGCTNNLIHLNLSRNQFTTKKSNHKDAIVPVSIKKFFSTAIFLRTIILSHNKLSPEVLKAILLGLACNESAADIRINLSSNDFKSNGAAVLELSLSDIRCVSGLDLSDNGLDMDLINVVNSISKNKSIKYLSIGRNFNNIKTKHLPKVLDSFVQLLQDPDCSIESLSLIDSKLRSETSIILNALGSNQSLINIDISGNLMGLIGAKTLAKALQVNNRLETIYLDRNLIPTTGFIDIAYSLERNFTVKYFPIPIQDVQAAMVKSPDRTETAVNKIQEFIRRNNLPQTATIRNMRLHNLNNSHSVVNNNLHTKIEKISLQLRQLIREKSLNNNRVSLLDTLDINSNSYKDKSNITDSDYVDDFARVENLLSEIQNLRSLSNKIQDIYTQAAQTMNGLSSNENFSRRFSISRPIEANILEFSKEIKRSFDEQVSSVSELIIQSLKEEFPHLFFQSQRLELDLRELYKNSLNTNSTTVSLVPSIEYFQLCLTEAVGAQWSIKLEQILNTIASQISYKVLLEVNKCLLSAQQLINNGCDTKSITNNYNNNHNNCFNDNGNSMRSLTPDVLLRNPYWIDSCSSHDSTDILSISKSDAKLLDGGDNAIATPKLNQKRQNVYIRKLRPQSVLDGAIVPNEDFPDLLVKPSPIDGSSLRDDPKNHVNLTKMRPRNRKTRAPTRVAIIDSKSKDSSNLMSSKIDEGLDSFFPSVSLMNNSSSATSIDSKEIEQFVQSYSCKPQPQPRKILRKIGFKNEQVTAAESSIGKNIDKPIPPPKSEELTRSTSPVIILPRRTEHVSLCSDNEIVHSHSRVHSPLPGGDIQQHNELLAEMKAIQEKRSYNSTPVSNEQMTFATALEKRQSSLEHLSDSSAICREDIAGTGSISVAKRATMFEDLHKSPSKHSINQNIPSPEELSEIVKDNVSEISLNNKNSYLGNKQRPKSVVGMLGAKFELSIMNNSNK